MKSLPLLSHHETWLYSSIAFRNSTSHRITICQRVTLSFPCWVANISMLRVVLFDFLCTCFKLRGSSNQSSTLWCYRVVSKRADFNVSNFDRGVDSLRTVRVKRGDNSGPVKCWLLVTLSAWSDLSLFFAFFFFHVRTAIYWYTGNIVQL